MTEKQHVYKLYENIVDWYDNARAKQLMEHEYLNLVLDNIAEHAEILDLGCGTGKPIAQFFIKNGHHITGIDGAVNMIARCKQRFPDATWLVSDMRTLHLNKKFDAIIAWDSFFHLPHNNQRAMFSIFKEHAKDGSILVFTSGPSHGEVTSNMDGYDFYQPV